MFWKIVNLVGLIILFRFGLIVTVKLKRMYKKTKKNQENREYFQKIMKESEHL